MAAKTVNVLDSYLRRVGVVVQYNSLIWAKRYVENGDCELYLPATTANINLLQQGRYLTIDGDDMVCIIRKIEITTDVEDGNYLTVTGYDVRCFLDQRILWGTYTCNGSVVDFLRKMVKECLIDSGVRKLVKPGASGALLQLGSIPSYSPKDQREISYTNLGDTVREICKEQGWGHKITLGNSIFSWSVYNGTSRISTVLFTPKLHNLKSSDYTNDLTKQGNVILVAGAEVGPNRKAQYVGLKTSIDRFEIFLDKKSNRQSMTYAELTAAFPGGQIIQTPSGSYDYFIFNFRFVVPDGGLETWIRKQYGSAATFSTVGSVTYCTITQAEMATLPSANPGPDDTVELWDLPYYIFLVNDGVEELTKYSKIESFDAEIIPDITYKYRSDYNLGDIVRIQNDYGITANVRITEAVEVWDTNGYQLQLKYEQL